MSRGDVMNKQLSRVDLENGNRICNKCRQELRIESFLKDKRCSRGRARTCKQCAYSNRDKKKQANLARSWYQNNRERVIAKQAERYQNNKKKLREYGRSHAKRNPEIYRAAFHRRRMKIDSNGRNSLTAGEISWLFENFPFCIYCEATENLTIDHVVPISKGGENTLENVVPACSSCNNQKRAKTLTEYCDTSDDLDMGRILRIRAQIGEKCCD
jgi:5-methylcytosine-specific restriction endonuclease McrA